MISHISVIWLLPLLSTLIIPISADCVSSLSCLCGSSNKTYRLCIDDVEDKEKPCDVWSNCSSCQANIHQCITCPENRTGPTCLEVKQMNKRKKYVKSSSRRPINAPVKGKSYECGLAPLQKSKQTFGQWPWTVAIAYSNGNTKTIICAGALLDRRTVLTAAHCVESHPAAYTLDLGKFYRRDSYDDDEVVKRVPTRIIIHEDFNNVTFENDIALVRFQPNIAFSERIQPICLPTSNTTSENLIPGRKGYATGWGFNEKKLLSDKMKVSHMPVQSDDECRDLFEIAGIELDDHPGTFCGGFSEEVVGMCRGDVGSPFVFLDKKTGRYTLEGLTSFGQSNKNCGEAKAYTMFTKVSHYVTWILRNLK